jgi:hypothetical protein
LTDPDDVPALSDAAITQREGVLGLRHQLLQRPGESADL